MAAQSLKPGKRFFFVFSPKLFVQRSKIRGGGFTKEAKQKLAFIALTHWSVLFSLLPGFVDPSRSSSWML